MGTAGLCSLVLGAAPSHLVYNLPCGCRLGLGGRFPLYKAVNTSRHMGVGQGALQA